VAMSVSIESSSVRLSVVMLSVVKFSVVKFSVVKFSVVKFSVVKFSVVKFSVVKFSAVKSRVVRGHPDTSSSHVDDSSAAPAPGHRYRQSSHVQAFRRFLPLQRAAGAISFHGLNRNSV